MWWIIGAVLAVIVIVWYLIATENSSPGNRKSSGRMGDAVSDFFETFLD